jgi:hypothetical protein
MKSVHRGFRRGLVHAFTVLLIGLALTVPAVGTAAQPADKAWAEPEEIAPQLSELQREPALARRPDGGVLGVWLVETDDGYFLYWSERNTDGVWTEPAPVGEEYPGNYGVQPTLVGLPDGSVTAVWGAYEDLDDFEEIALISTLSAEGEWSEPEPLPFGLGGSIQLTSGRDGELYATWARVRGWSWRLAGAQPAPPGRFLVRAKRGADDPASGDRGGHHRRR